MTESPAPASSTRFRRSLLVVLVALLVAAIGFLVLVFTTRDVDALGLDGGELSQSEDRSTVQSQARQFILRLNNYGPDLLNADKQMPEYRTRVADLLTAKFRDSFEQLVTIAEQQAAGGAGRTAEVYATGVSSIDPDSASVVVASSFVQTYPTEEGGTVDSDPAVFRVVVELVKTKGTWLVDNFTPVANPVGASSEPTSIPSFTSGPTPSQPTQPTQRSQPSLSQPAQPTEDPTSQPSMTTLSPFPTPAPTSGATSGATP